MKASFFEPVSPKTDFVLIEQAILKRWERLNIEEKYLSKNRDSAKRHSFIDGPITANNPMGVHHAWGRAYKDIFQRFRNMQGFRQRFQNGFDGQGLWVEVEVEKAKGFRSKKEIETYGVGRFVQECKERVNRFADRITEQSKRLGYFMDWDNSYHTMSEDNNYAIWHFLKKCQEKGWLYEGEDVMPWCTRCGTGLSQHEIVTDGYKEVDHPGLFVMFPLSGSEASLLIWTTTPWTLAANVAAAVHPENEYVRVKNSWNTAKGEKSVELWLGADRLKVLKGEWDILERAGGRTLAGLEYVGPFDELPAQQEAKNKHRVILWKDVNNEEGTGIVHIAPGAGAEDFRLGKEHHLPVVSPLNDDGYYKEGFGKLEGVPVADAKEPIYDDLRRKDLFYRLERIRHRYPHCWRCGSELVFRLVSEWFISMDELRQPMMDATKQMEWVPAFGRERELDWLRNMQDWMISKKRYWGLALPIFKCAYGCVEVIGSREELRQRAVEGWADFDGHSPHRPWVDAVKIECHNCKGEMTRIKDVGNPWLDAGIVGFSTLGYGKDDDYWRDWFPADWISESFPGQFRNWFYSLIAMSVALAGKPPARTVFSYALMRDQNGEEMHKSQGNAIWFEDAADEIGVDVMRWLFSRHDFEKNLNFGVTPCDEVRRKFFIPLWNVYSFFVTYALIDGWTADEASDTGNRSELDRWILAELNQLVRSATQRMEGWKINIAVLEIEAFTDVLSNWYVRRSRRRFWKGQLDADKQAAYSTLYTCLVTLCRLLAPFIPFVVDEIYRNLVSERLENAPPSVHLTDWPTFDETLIDTRLIEETRIIIKLAGMGRAARAQAGIKVRQPLEKVIFGVPNAQRELIAGGAMHIQALLAEELNVRSIEWSEEGEQSGSGTTAVTVKLNYRTLGPKHGKRIGAIDRIVAENQQTVAAIFADKDEVPISDLVISDLLSTDESYAHAAREVEELTISREDLLIEETPHGGGTNTISEPGGWWAGISSKITPELRAEGWAREVIHRVQNLRKSAGLDIADRIRLRLGVDADMVTPLESHGDLIKNETLAERLLTGEGEPLAHREKFKLDGYAVEISLEKV